MDEDEEIWFNEEEDYAETAGKSGTPELDSTIGKMFEKKAMDTSSSLNGPKYGSGAVSTAQSHQLSSQMHGGVTATATSADDVAATSHLLTINNGTDGTTTDDIVATSAAHLQSSSLVDPNCLSHAVAQAAAAAVANNNGLPSSSSPVAVETVSSLGEIGHEHLQHHKDHHRVLEDDASSANLTPADESALDDANSLVVSALGESDLSAVYQLQTTTGAVSSTVVASTSCETTPASSTLSSIPATPPILDSAPAVEQPESGGADLSLQDSLSSSAASVGSSTNTTAPTTM
uniref:Ataxin-2 C-terminal domain-containing protein n=1 Tax=Anopheles maculatus TaxID=74869 RepID=A0A182SGE1_9DIPT